MDEDFSLPPPEPSESDWEEYRRTGFEPLFFEWYKFSAAEVNLLSGVQPHSPAFKCQDPRSYYVLSGLLHRCVRLMLANIALSHEGSFGETAAIIDRCICESAIRIAWLCQEDSDARIRRYLEDSLRPELEFESQIQANIERRGGEPLPIEERMLRSIDRHITKAGSSRQELEQSKRLPDMASMLDCLGYRRLDYVILQRIGSHHIHGTWPSLLLHYLVESDLPNFEFEPRHNSIHMHINQYVHGCRFVLSAAVAYSRFFLADEEAANFEDLFTDIASEMLTHYQRAIDSGA